MSNIINLHNIDILLINILIITKKSITHKVDCLNLTSRINFIYTVF